MLCEEESRPRATRPPNAAATAGEAYLAFGGIQAAPVSELMERELLLELSVWFPTSGPEACAFLPSGIMLGDAGRFGRLRAIPEAVAALPNDLTGAEVAAEFHGPKTPPAAPASTQAPPALRSVLRDTNALPPSPRACLCPFEAEDRAEAGEAFRLGVEASPRLRAAGESGRYPFLGIRISSSITRPGSKPVSLWR